MKKVLILSLCAVLALGMTACDDGAESAADSSSAESSADSAAATETLPEVPEGAIADESGSFVYTGPLQQGGDDENGYIQVPLGYVTFKEEGVEGLTQYSDVTGTNVITLDYYEGVNYQDGANSLYYYMSQEEYVEGLTGATVQVNGYNSLQLYAHYTDDDKFLVTWMIEDPANTANSYYLAIEFMNEDSDIMACSSTFQTVEDYHASNPEA